MQDKKEEKVGEQFSLEEIDRSGLDNVKKEAFTHLEARYRSAGRKKVRLRCDVEVLLRNKRLFTSGKATIQDLSATGVFLSNFALQRKSFPAQPFILRLKFRNKDFRGVTLVCEPIRISTTNGKFGMGLKFQDIMIDIRNK
ncbi:MAG: PilZ domain-containing protein [Planctomycetota bacterium]|nr:PilZ domain-containing protein [Planctomycetota bacterium]